MFKKMAVIVFCGLLLFGMYGCLAIFAGTAGGAGTSAWLSGKLTQEFNASYERVILAAKDTLRAYKLDLVKETREETVTQLRSKYTDGKEMWIDIRKISDNSTQVEVRVGVVNPDKKAAEKILRKIQKYL